MPSRQSIPADDSSRLSWVPRPVTGLRGLIAHGLYPREPLTERALSGLVDHLAVGTNVIDGRTYAGALTKFEPREMERLFVPGLDVLETATV